MKKNHVLTNCIQFWELKKLLLPPKLIIILCAFLITQVFAVSNVVAQKQKVSGTVSDASTSEPIIGVNVLVTGTNTGTVTDLDGRFSIEVPDANSELTFSYVGFLSQKIIVNNQSVIDVKLEPDVQKLDEIIVVGYGTSKKSDITGSVVSVNTKDMLKKAPSNILQGLKGQAAGVVIASQDGAPDANSAVYIRGIATINGTSKPLYVVDGVVVGDNANFLNPNDVENLEVLKDASATAIYGSAGANGVIMVTTKHGKVGKPHINFSADYGIQTLAYKLDVGDADQYAKNIRTARANDGNLINNPIFTEQYDGLRKTIDWQKELTRPAARQQYYLSATGGTENTQHSLSLGYLNHDGLVVNTNMNRITARANIITKVANFLEVGGDLGFSHTENKGSNIGFGNNGNLSSLRDMAFFCPTMDYVDKATNTLISPNVKNSNGTYGSPIQGPTGTYDGSITENLYAQQMEQNELKKGNRLVLSTYANIKFLKNFNFKSIASYQLNTTNSQNFWGNTKRYMPDGVTEVERYNYDARYGLSINNGQTNTLGLESYFTYNLKITDHNVTVMAGNSISKSYGDWSSSEARDFPAENIRDISLTSDLTTRTGSGAYNRDSRMLSYYGRLTYSFMDRYILTSTIRRDGSSNFGADNLWGTFPSVALAWRVSEESFLKGIPVISNLKLRLGWGQTGNSGGMGGKAVASLSSRSIQYFFYNQNGVAGLGSERQINNGYVPSLVDTRLKWETNEQTNIGIDLGLFNGEISLTADYFIRDTKDLLLLQQIRPSAGPTQIYTNYGGILNKGIEFSLSYNKQINKDWNIGATITGTALKNEIKDMGLEMPYTNETTTNDGSNVGAVGTPASVYWGGHSLCRNGYAVGSYYGYQVEGVFQTQAEVDKANADAVLAGHEYYQQDKTGRGDFKYKDLNGDSTITEKDMTILGDGFPKLNYGLNINVSYKKWDLAVYTYGVLGQKINSYSAMTLSNVFASDNGTTPNILNSASSAAWTPENGSNTLSKLSIMDYNRNMRASDAWIKKANYFKISTIQIGYTFNKGLLNPLRLESARIYFSIQNVLTISPYNEFGDPEVGQGSVLLTGLDTGRYPMPRIFSCGVNIQF